MVFRDGEALAMEVRISNRMRATTMLATLFVALGIMAAVVYVLKEALDLKG
jgi:hypothetical protein